MVKCPKRTAEFKKRAAGLYHARGGTCAEIARKLGCDAGSVSDWARKERAGGLQAADNPFQAGEELARLRRENERLRKENEILLKASAFFASRELRGRRSSSS